MINLIREVDKETTQEHHFYNQKDIQLSSSIVKDASIPIEALYNQTVNKILGNKHLLKLNDLPVSIRVQNYGQDSQEITYESSYFDMSFFHRTEGGQDKS